MMKMWWVFTMGPPKFRDAAFTYNGSGLTLQIRAKYGV
jgi:uncharacterized protein (DUF2141 family)